MIPNQPIRRRLPLTPDQAPGLLFCGCCFLRRGNLRDSAAGPSFAAAGARYGCVRGCGGRGCGHHRRVGGRPRRRRRVQAMRARQVEAYVWGLARPLNDATTSRPSRIMRTAVAFSRSVNSLSMYRMCSGVFSTHRRSVGVRSARYCCSRTPSRPAVPPPKKRGGGEDNGHDGVSSTRWQWGNTNAPGGNLEERRPVHSAGARG